MADPTIVTIEGTIASHSIEGTIAPHNIEVNVNEYSWYAQVLFLKDFEAAGLAGFQITDFPDIPMDSMLVVHLIESQYKNPNKYGEWEE